MDAAKADSILAGHMSAVRKVYGAVPMREPWPFSKIHNELIRTGVRQDRHKLEGCVRQLVDSGLFGVSTTTTSSERRSPERKSP